MEHLNNGQYLSRQKRLFYFAAMVVFSVVVTLTISEVTIRMLYPQQEAMRWFTSSDRYGFLMKKNFHQRYHYVGSDFSMDVRTNSLGLRDQEYDLTRKDAKRILLIGDSFTFGYGVNVQDNFDTKLENLLNRNSENWMVINAGHGGWGTLQETKYATDHFALFEPDIIVLTFCGNDPSDDIWFSQNLKDSAKGVFYFPGKIFIRNHSHLYRLLFYKYKNLLHNWMLSKTMHDADKDEILGVDDQSASLITKEQWVTTLGYIKDFQAEYLKFNPKGILLVMASAPLNDQIRTHLASLSNGVNLFYVDLFADVSKLPPGQRIMPHDTHWSAKMHSIAAENLYQTIRHLKN